MTLLPTILHTSLQRHHLLVIWGSIPLALSELEPGNRVLMINRWLEQAKALLPIPMPLTALPPAMILSLDPTTRVERAFKSAGVALRVVKTRDDVPAHSGHNLLKLGGDLASRTGIILSRAGVHDLLDDNDKHYLLDEARLIAHDGAVVVVGADSVNADFEAWWCVLRPALGAVSVHAIGDAPTDVLRLAVDFDELINELRNVIMPGELSDSSRSGGLNVNSNETHIGGDLTGRDKLVDESTHGDIYNIHIEHAENLAIGRGAQVPGMTANALSASGILTGSADTRASLQYQLEQARENLRLIEERISEFVMSTSVDLNLVKQQRQLQVQIAKLEKQFAE